MRSVCGNVEIRKCGYEDMWICGYVDIGYVET